MNRNVPILHVEDDPVDVGNLQRAWARLGVRNPLWTVGNGEEALDLLRSKGPHAHEPRPGLILLDLSMPVMSGLEFLREVKSDPELRLIPTVVLTASNHETDRRNAYDLGAAGYLVKPIEFPRFAEVVGAIERYWALCEAP
jgi:CheY-like chemotaxis protein